MHIHMQTLQHTCIPHFYHRHSCHRCNSVMTHTVNTMNMYEQIWTIFFKQNHVFVDTGVHGTVVYAGLHLCISQDWWQSDTEKTLHWHLLVWSTRNWHIPLMEKKGMTIKQCALLSFKLILQYRSVHERKSWWYPYWSLGCRDVQILMWCRDN